MANALVRPLGDAARQPVHRCLRRRHHLGNGQLPTRRGHLSGYVFAFIVLLAVRRVALMVGLLMFESGIDLADKLFHLAAIVIAASMVAHSSTDVLVARWFERAEAEIDEGRERSAGHLSG